MIDPLSVSASIIAVLTLAEKVIEYLNDVKSANEDRQRIRSELYGAMGVLYILRGKDTQVQQGDPWFMTSQALGGPNGPIEQFKMILEQLVKRLMPYGGWKKISAGITWPFQKGEVRDLLNAIERQKTLFIFAQQNDHIELFKATRDDVRCIRSEVGELNDRFTRTRGDERYQKIRRWLNAPDPSTNYNKGLRGRFPKTGTWFIESPAFIHWRRTPGSFLWLYGIPGCGKSILSSTIIESVFNHCSPKPTLAVLYFYFDFSNGEKQHCENLIRSLIIQLSLQSTNTPEALETLYSSCMNGERQPGYDLLLTTLRHMIGDFEETYIVLDALDECVERHELLGVIDELTGWKDANFHILTTSRREKDIEESLERLSDEQGKISIQSELVNDDIRSYIQGRLQTDKYLSRWRNKPEIQQQIENTLTDKAGGMFRWAACQLDSLKDCLNVSGLRKALVSLPKTLDDTYARILCNISDEKYRYAFKVLQWLTFSVRPLKLDEVAEIITVSADEIPRFNPENRLVEPRDILTTCASLVSLEDQPFGDFDKRYFRSDNESSSVLIRLAHFSVKEYLVSDRILQGDAKRYNIQELKANMAIQNDCVAYLLQFDEPDSLTPQSLAKSPLALYAARYWIQHAHMAEKCTDYDPTLIMELFLTERDSLLNWIRLGGGGNTFLNIVDLRRSSSDVDPPLHYASMAGLYKLVYTLLDRGANVNTQGGKYGTALIAASERGHTDIVKMLLNNGAKVNTQGGIYSTALIAASERGHTDIVKMLLNNGAKVNTQGGIYSTALIAASERGHTDIVKMLLNNGAKVNTRGGRNGNALITASERGHTDIVKMLLNNGAKVNTQGGRYGNALIAASLNGHTQIVQILLDNGADINAQAGFHGSALGAAAFWGRYETVRLLLKNGVDVNARFGNFHRSALASASARDQPQIVQILLGSGADAKVEALVAAPVGRHDEVVQILLNSEAGIKRQALEAWVEEFRVRVRIQYLKGTWENFQFPMPGSKEFWHEVEEAQNRLVQLQQEKEKDKE